MKVKIYAMMFLLSIVFISCKEAKEEEKTINPKVNKIETSQEIENNISEKVRSAVIRNLQGEWKEPEYPFNVVIFKDSTVKFIEEGVVEAPTFKNFIISGECPSQVNNIRDLQRDDLILVVGEAGRCEKIKISNDTLTLSGFNVNTNSNYNIIYKRVK